jgi:glutathione S-transferase
MKLYHAPGSCSQAICIVLREAQFDAQIVTVDARRHRFDDGRDYRAVNELGYVPLLVLDDGTTLREGPVIAQYLADRRPEAGLAPAYGTLARYRLMEWLNFLGTEIHKGSFRCCTRYRRANTSIRCAGSSTAALHGSTGSSTATRI